MLSHDDDIQTHTQFILFNIVMFFLEVHASEDWQLEIHLVADPPPPQYFKKYLQMLLLYFFMFFFFWRGGLLTLHRHRRERESPSVSQLYG